MPFVSALLTQLFVPVCKSCQLSRMYLPIYCTEYITRALIPSSVLRQTKLLNQQKGPAPDGLPNQ